MMPPGGWSVGREAVSWDLCPRNTERGEQEPGQLRGDTGRIQKEGSQGSGVGCCTKHHKLGELKTTEIYCLILNVGCLRATCHRAALLPKALGEGPCCLLRLLGAAGVLGDPWLVAMSHQFLPQLSHDVPVCLSLRICLLIRTPVTFALGPALLSYDLLLTNYICRTPSSK